MSFVGFLIMLLTSSVMENPAAQKNISFFPRQYEYYLNFTAETDVKLRETSRLPLDFRMRAYQPQTINLILSLWIIGNISSN